MRAHDEVMSPITSTTSGESAEVTSRRPRPSARAWRSRAAIALSIALFAEFQQVLDARCGLLGIELGVVAERGLAGGEGLPATALSAAAERAVGVDGNVSELAGETAAAGENLAVGEDRRADAFGDSDQHGVAHAVHAAEPEFAEQACVGGVLELDLQIQPFGERLLHVEVGPVQVRRKDDALCVRIDSAGNADADALNALVRVLLAHRIERFGHLDGGALGVGGKRNGLTRKEASVEVDDREDRLTRPQVGDERHEFRVEREHRRAATAWALGSGAFGDPAFLEQLLDDCGDRARLQAGEPGQLGAADRLIRADQLEHDVAVDVTRHLARGEFYVSQVDSSAALTVRASYRFFH